MAFCTNCGAELAEGVRFCTNCGASVEDFDDGAAEGGMGELDATMLVEERPTLADEGTRQGIEQTRLWASAQAPEDTSPQFPPTMPPRYPEPPMAAPARKSGTGKVVGIVLGVVAAVAVVGFALFYFLNPLGLTTGIFENSAAAQAEAAAQAQADADAAQAELEATQSENEELQKQLDEANKQSPTSETPSSGAGDDAVASLDEGAIITAPAGYPTVRVGNSGEVLPGSSYRTITEDDISDMNDWELCVARNEIYARHGYAFQREDLQEFFSNLSWYQIDPDYDESDLSKLEIDNANTILEVEKSHNSPYLQ